MILTFFGTRADYAPAVVAAVAIGVGVLQAAIVFVIAKVGGYGRRW